MIFDTYRVTLNTKSDLTESQLEDLSDRLISEGFNEVDLQQAIERVVESYGFGNDLTVEVKS